MKLKLINDDTWIAEGKDDEFKCFCGEQVKDGYSCEERGVLCRKCQDKLNHMADKWPICKYNSDGEHAHIKFIRKH